MCKESEGRSLSCQGFMFLLLFFSTGSAVAYKDPTEPSHFSESAPASTETEAVTQFVLDAVLISDEERLAVINNTTLKIGQSIGDNKVTAIDTYSVTLRGSTGEIVLHLFGQPIKKEPSK